MYALVTPACSLQTRMGLHLVAAVSLALTLLLAWLAWRAWSALAGAAAQEDATVAPAATRRLLAAAATAVAGFSSLVIVAMWAGAWLLSPCDVWP